MANLHAQPDTLYETMARESDLCPAMIVSSTWPTPPGSGLTIPAFPTQAYIRKGEALYYVDQPAVPVTVANVAGNHWLGVTTDTHSTIAGWTRVSGSHYVHIQSATQPGGADDLLGFAQVVVSGGHVTSVTPLYTSPVDEAWRQWLHLGTMSTQNAGGVAITGGTITAASGTFQDLLSLYAATAVKFEAQEYAGANQSSFAGQKTAGVNRWNLYMVGTANNYLQGPLSLAAATPDPNCQLFIRFRHDSISGILLRPLDSDSGAFQPLVFLNQAGGVVGSIATTGAATAYNTSSDRRLKERITTLRGALEVVRALRPVSFRWRQDDSPGVGFLAQEAQAVVPEAVTGSPTDPAPTMQMDLSKLVPHLVGACQELAQQVQTLQARVQQLEGATA